VQSKWNISKRQLVKLEAIKPTWKDERNVDTWHNIRLAHSTYAQFVIMLYIPYIKHIYTLPVCILTSGIVIHYTGWGRQSLSPQDIHCFKREACVRFAWLNWCVVFQELNPGINWDLPVFKTVHLDGAINWVHWYLMYNDPLWITNSKPTGIFRQ